MPDEPRSGLAGYLAQLFAYIDKPWKVGAVILLVLVGGGALVFYEERDTIIEAWMTPDAPELKTEEIPAALDKLAEETDADLVQAWSIDLATNSQQFIAARRRDGERPVIPNPRRLPVITTTTDAKALVDVLNGTPACLNLSAAGSPLARRVYERGMKRACAIAIPPTGDAFVGVIYLAWSAPPSEHSEGDAVAAAKEIARTLARR